MSSASFAIATCTNMLSLVYNASWDWVGCKEKTCPWNSGKGHLNVYYTQEGMLLLWRSLVQQVCFLFLSTSIEAFVATLEGVFELIVSSHCCDVITLKCCLWLMQPSDFKNYLFGTCTYLAESCARYFWIIMRVLLHPFHKAHIMWNTNFIIGVNV